VRISFTVSATPVKLGMDFDDFKKIVRMTVRSTKLKKIPAVDELVHQIPFMWAICRKTGSL
jgi:hypothetical protein